MSGILIAYYSRSGNSGVVAQQIESITGGDLFKIETVADYPADYHETTAVARQELRENARPELKRQLASVAGYDTVFLGYPDWWGTAPMAVFTFLEAHDFSGKTIVPFCTHEGTGLGRSESDIRAACPGATVLDGLAIRGSGVRGAQQGVRQWVKSAGL